MAEGVNVGELMILEYERIKEEQKTRIGFRDNLLYATLGSMAVVVAVTVSSDSAVPLLLLPPVSVILGWTYLVNDEKISAIGRYVRTELAPQLAALIGQDATVFGWEIAHRADRRRVSRKYGQLAVDLLTFCVMPLTAIVVYWLSGEGEATLIVASVAEVGIVGLLASQIVSYADMERSP